MLGTGRCASLGVLRSMSGIGHFVPGEVYYGGVVTGHCAQLGVSRSMPGRGEAILCLVRCMEHAMYRPYCAR